MAHDPRILSFYATQLQTRQRRLAGWPETDNYGEKFLACLAIVLALSAFLWVYEELVHRDPLSIPTLTASAGHNRTRGSVLTAREVPAPNMASPAVARASEDVPEQIPMTASTTQAEPTPAVTAPPKKRKVHHVKRLPRGAADAYAADPGFFGSPFRGF